jgi:hypothetical protein
VGQAYEHGTFFSRLHHFVLGSDAVVVMPGGIGTTLEALMIWQLLQVRRLYGTPLIMIGRMRPDLVQWAKTTCSASRLTWPIRSISPCPGAWLTAMRLSRSSGSITSNGSGSGHR